MPSHCQSRFVRRRWSAALVLALLLALLGFPNADAEPARPAHVGVLLFGSPATEANVAALVAGLRELGYEDGRNLKLAYRGADGHPERVRDMAQQLVALQPDVIVVLGGDVVPIAREETRTIPIVMLTSNNPVEAGLIESFARPGGNLTGVAFVAAETGAKRLQFLKEAVPSLRRVAVLWNPEHPDGEYHDVRAAARQLGVDVESLEVRRPEDFDAAFQRAARLRADALMVVSSRLVNLNRARVLEFVGTQRIPLVSGWGAWAVAGGLLSYGPDLDVLARRAAVHIDKILKGAKPSELAVEQPTRFELVLNLKTARALGVTMPPSLLSRADRVIE